MTTATTTPPTRRHPRATDALPMPKHAAPDTAADAPDAETTTRTKYHEAAFNALRTGLAEYEDSGALELKYAYKLAEAPLEIDMIVIKKIRDVKVEEEAFEMPREYNLFEFKSPVDNAPNMKVFNKVMGYTYIYAEQKDIDITDMSATILCYKKPTALLEALEAKKCYEILHKGGGVYYILSKDVPVESVLIFRIVVILEAPRGGDLADLLKLLSEDSGIPKERIFELLRKDKKGLLPESYWSVVALKNSNERSDAMGILEIWEKQGILAEYLSEHDQKVKQEGRLEGVNKVLALLNIDPNKAAEVKRQLHLQPA